MFRKFLLFLVVLFGLAACTTPQVQTKVEAISAMPDVVKSKTIFVQPFKGQNTKSLSWRQNIGILENELAKKGYATVSSKNNAMFVAYFGYAIDQGEKVTTSYSMPQYGVTGYSGANTYGSVYGNTYTTTTTLTPTYGITGYNKGSVTEVIFTRSAKLDIYDRKTGEQVFDGKAMSSGSCYSFAPVAPYIIASILSEFPKGKIGNVALPAEDLEC